MGKRALAVPRRLPCPIEICVRESKKECSHVTIVQNTEHSTIRAVWVNGLSVVWPMKDEETAPLSLLFLKQNRVQMPPPLVLMYGREQETNPKKKVEESCLLFLLPAK